MSKRTPFVAPCLNRLLGELDALFVHRDHASDGGIGDAAHAATKSRHNPLKAPAPPVIEARDFDVDGMDAAWFAEELRKIGASGDSRLNPGGEVIYNRRIATAAHGWVWRHYTGPSAHTDHVHVSSSSRAAGYNRTSSWGLAARWKARLGAAVKATAHADRVVREGDRDGRGEVLIRGIQHALNVAAGERVLVEDGIFGPKLTARVRLFQGRHGLDVDGIVGADTLRLLRAVPGVH